MLISWFQPLNLTCDLLVLKFAFFKWFNFVPLRLGAADCGEERVAAGGAAQAGGDGRGGVHGRRRRAHQEERDVM